MMIIHILMIIFLTILTQTGGLIYIIALLSSKALKRTITGPVTFILIYALCSGVLLPWFSSYGGRVPLPVDHPYIKPGNWFTVICNRHYVAPLVKQEMVKVAEDIAQTTPGYKMVYLDANFPFFKGFPLIPHLSHNDGKKVDIAFTYNSDNKITTKLPSIWGYGNYVDKSYSPNQVCPESGTSYGITEKLPFTEINPGLEVNHEVNTRVANRILKAQRIEKIFVEPYLKSKWKLNSNKVRFQGCHAVRHDDHFHVQFR
ncbi:hypothetical protein [Marinigracilibium pacificum]|uniref:Uncharacterized protein n=1 Tax=Marinigracilibium pacificum TaxID=2729599 RepID=A0A848IZL6_9BACT|nr:hypothetical protein [Marinigracilibium pacificum]NMM49727.1 hypothetical protein [Marinigracilibium pacificum]